TSCPLSEGGLAADGRGNHQNNPQSATARELGTLLEQVRHTAAQLLSQLSPLPRVVRMRVGEVAIDIEWDATTTSPAGSPRCDQPVSATNGDLRRLLTAQVVGVFFRAAEPGGKPFVNEGDMVVAGQQMAVIEAMKLMVPVESDLNGRVVEVLKNDGEPVEY